MAETYNFQSPFVYGANNPITNIDNNGESPLRAVVAAYRYSKKSYKVYKRLKKSGEKFTSKHFKQAGIEELADIGGDLMTIFDGGASGWDKAGAAVDLIIGTDFNNKGQKAINKVLDEVTEKVKGVYKNKHKNGKSYVGKGNKSRQKQSQKTKEKYNGETEESEYVNSKSDNDAKEEEAMGIRDNGTTKTNSNSLNKNHTGRKRVNEEFGGGKF